MQTLDLRITRTHRATPRQGLRGRPQRLLFIGEAVSLAHVGRPLVLARWARQAGYHVTFACGAAHSGLARAEGLAPIDLPTISAQEFYGRCRRGQFFYREEELHRYVRAEVELIRSTRPDLVVADFRLTAALAGQLTGVPTLALLNSHWSPAAACRMPPPADWQLSWLPGPLAQALFACLRPLAFRRFARPLERVCRSLGLDSHADFRGHYGAGTWCAYLDLPDFIPIRQMPPNHFHLGPLWWEPADGDLDLAGIDATRPLVHVTMGTHGRPDLTRTLLQVVHELDWAVALAGVDAEQAEGWRQEAGLGRSRFLAAGLVNPRTLLQRAAVTVCHGGSGTVYQSIAAGVPVLALPDNPDQGLVAAALCRQGAGLMVPPAGASAHQLRQALTQLVHTKHHARQAQRLAARIQAHDTRQHWLDFLAKHVARDQTMIGDAFSMHNGGAVGQGPSRHFGNLCIFQAENAGVARRASLAISEWPGLIDRAGASNGGRS